jgi:hypothetical protein
VVPPRRKGQSLTWLVASAATGWVKSSRVIVGDSENAGTVQRVVGHSSQEEQNMVATVGQNCAQKTRRARQGLNRKEICRSKYDMQDKMDQQG